MKVLKYRDRIEAAGATAVFIVHDDPDLVRTTMIAGLDVGFRVLIDCERSAYRAWGLERATLLRIWADPRVWARYLTAVLRGNRPSRFGVDTLQLGGDFVVDAGGVIVYSRPQHRDDRPPVAHLWRALGSAAGSVSQVGEPGSEGDAGEARELGGEPGQLSRGQEYTEGDEGGA